MSGIARRQALWFLSGRLEKFFVVSDRPAVPPRAFNVTAGPTAQWVSQQLHAAFPEAATHRFLIYDNDAIFCPAVSRSRVSVSVPSARRFRVRGRTGRAERFVGTVRRELLDHVVLLSEDHLRRPLQEFITYYRQKLLAQCELDDGLVLAAPEQSEDAPKDRDRESRYGPHRSRILLESPARWEPDSDLASGLPSEDAQDSGTALLPCRA